MFVQVPNNLKTTYLSIISFVLTITLQGQFGLN